VKKYVAEAGKIRWRLDSCDSRVTPLHQPHLRA